MEILKGASEILMAGIIDEGGNSEKIKAGAWRSYRPVYTSEKCKHCMLCVPPCPDDAIIYDKEGKMHGIDYDKCKGCGVCAKVCPFGAIHMEKEDIGGGESI